MKATPTRAQYDAAFDLECRQRYPAVLGVETASGFAIERSRLQSAARILACPVKANPPCWQHGRVLYAVARRYLDGQTEPVHVLDIGTAKGFSALVLQWALLDSGVPGQVESVDVIDPLSREYRNSVLELDGPKRLAEYLQPWPEAAAIRFYQSTGIDWLSRSAERVHIAFIDGKHTGAVVAKEAALLSKRQEPGDLVVFDDVHIPDVCAAVDGMASAYLLELVQVLPQRAYAIGVRR
jgi:predicted O-methyltransferase YrrM